jgi:hypothetical protein
MPNENETSQGGSSGGQPTGGQETPQPTINRVSATIPPFWSKNPKLWFAQVEAGFRNAGITTDNTMYDKVVGQIDTKILEQIQDIVVDPPTENRYKTLKDRLIAEFTDSEGKKLSQLLSAMELGDQKPSHLLRTMKNLAGDSIRGKALETLFLQHLPDTARGILSAFNAV